MANEVEKVALIAVSNIEKIDLITVANIEKLSGMEISSGSTDTWSSAGAMHDAMSGAGQGFGLVNTAVVVAGGYEGAFTAETQERNGTTWTTESATLSATRQQYASAGSATSGLACGGWPGAGGNTDVVQKYNGSAWSTGESAISVGKGANRCVGTSNTSILQALGDVSGGTTGDAQQAQLYNGSTWTNKSDPTNGAGYTNAFGESGAARFCGGYGYPGAMNGVQYWNGTSWNTSVTTRIYQTQQAGAFGTSSAGVIFGGAGATTSGDGYAANQDHADKWNGTAFSAASTVPYGKNDLHGAGITTAGIGFGGGGGSPVDTCVTYA